MKRQKTKLRAWPALSTLLGLGLCGLLAPGVARAQSAIIYGSLGNFDIANDTGKVCHGFEVQLDGLTAADVPYAFSVNRYGAPRVIASATGVAVRWAAIYDAASGTWSDRTLQHTVPWFPGQCYQWTGPAVYQDSGCEHFGVGATGNPTTAQSHWLCEDPAAPGVLVPDDPPTAVPLPIYYVAPPVAPGNPPQLVVEVPAPEPAESPSLFGDAQWIRVFVTQLPIEVTLDELVADDPAVVPMDPAQLESNYAILQDEPAAGGNGKRKRHRNQGNLLPTTRSVVRRIETWEFTGSYDPVTHEALCADGVCNAPAPDEIGNLISTQMTVALVQSDSVTVTKSGSGGGNVDSADKRIACGSKCVAPYDNGQVVTLTAKAGSGSVFAGWTGACSGTATTCAVAAVGHTDVGALFALAPSGGGGGGGGGATKQVTLSVGRSNPGAVVASPAGVDRVLSCGNACSARFTAGTVVTLTATPPDGKQFVGWGGACAGTSRTCTVAMVSDLSVQASFGK